LEKQAGGIFEQSHADLIAIPFHAKVEDSWSAAVHHTGPVTASMIDGKWVHGDYGCGIKLRVNPISPGF
jgi:hypothetical protein